MVIKCSEFTDTVRVEANFEDSEDVTRIEPDRGHYRLGRCLAQARLEKRLTQRQVAKAAHVDQGQVSEVERGVGNPTLRILTAVANAVGLNVELRPSSHPPVAAVDRPRKAREPKRGGPGAGDQ